MIRPVYKEELKKCVEIIQSSFLTVAREYGFTAFSTSIEKLKSQYQEERPMFVFINNQAEIIGYYSLCLQKNRICELNNLCVLPEYRHKKIGERLLNHALICAAGLGYQKITFGMVAENKKLKKWYERFGFISTGTKKFDFFPFTCEYMEKPIQ